MTQTTDEEIKRAAERFEQLADAIPDDAQFTDISDLREVAEAADSVRDNEARLYEAVQVARAHGHSWNRIALALGVSRQAARQRFGDKAA